MCSINNINSIDNSEMFLILLNRKILMKHLNLICCLDSKLDEFISTKYDDISNMIQLTYNVKYDSMLIPSILNLLKSNQISSTLFSLENVDQIINNYFLTLASSHSIKPFTLLCLDCQQPLKLYFKEKVNVFLMDRVDSGVTYSARYCHIEYRTNSYIKSSKRFVSWKPLYNQQYINFGSKCVLSIEVLLRYTSELINMVS